MSKRVLQIAYDPGLLITRELLLKKRGYQVVSVFGSAAAKDIVMRDPEFDLAIVGHAAPRELRQELVQWLKEASPGIKVVALNPPHHGSVSTADYNIPLNGPDEWLRAVATAIG